MYSHFTKLHIKATLGEMKGRTFWEKVISEKEAKEHKERLRVLLRFGRFEPPYRNSWEAYLGEAIKEHLKDKKE